MEQEYRLKKKGINIAYSLIIIPNTWIFFFLLSSEDNGGQAIHFNMLEFVNTSMEMEVYLCDIDIVQK